MSTSSAAKGRPRPDPCCAKGRRRGGRSREEPLRARVACAVASARCERGWTGCTPRAPRVAGIHHTSRAPWRALAIIACAAASRPRFLSGVEIYAKNKSCFPLCQIRTGRPTPGTRPPLCCSSLAPDLAVLASAAIDERGHESGHRPLAGTGCRPPQS